MKNENKVKIILSVVIAVVAIVFVVALVATGSKDPTVQVNAGSIVIEGMYGVTVDFNDIAAVSLLDESMSELDYGKRVNGYGDIGQAAKGNFSSATLGEILLFVQLDASPTIYINRENDKNIYISFADSTKTAALYEDIVEAMK